MRVLGIVASAVLVIVAVVLALQGGDNAGGDAPPRDQPPRVVTVDELEALAADLGHPIYWAGERAAKQLEVKEEGEGNVYLRYLPAGVEAGDPGVRFLTVGTYPVAEAAAALRRSAAEEGATLERIDGAVVMRSGASTGSVYLAYPRSDLQIEVYDPRPGRSLRLVRAGAIRPLG